MGGKGQARGEASLEELLQRGFRYALSLTHDPDLAADLVQDAWVAILEGDRPRHAGYLFATLRHRAVDVARRNAVLRFEPFDPFDTAPASPHPTLIPDLSEEALRVDFATLKQSLGTLRQEEREALYLSAVEGWTLGEIGRLTNRPPGTVASLLSRGRDKLRRAFGPGNQKAAR